MFHARLTAAVIVAAGAVGGAGGARPAVQDFTFVHCSDVHVPPGVDRRTGPANGPQFGSTEVIAQIKGLTAPIELKPYRVTVPPPSFAIATGDLTEFGGLNGWWDQYLRLWQGAPFPVYHESGNHDSTWASQRYRIRELHGSPFYSFDRFGCHFIGWDSASVQDPRPSFGEEELRWLRQDLKRVSKETPVFLFCHHPVDSKEFASLYERDRLLDVLRPYNLALLLVGHGHAAQHRVVAGVDQVMGGSTFGNAPGYSVVSVKDGVLRVAYRRGWEDAPSQPLLERPLATRSSYPRIEIEAPRDGRSVAGESVQVRAEISASGITAGRWTADDEEGRTGELRRDGKRWIASIDTSGWEAGSHYLRLTFQGAGKSEYQRTTRIELVQGGPVVRWRSEMAGSGRGTPRIDGRQLLAGGQDGVLYAFDRRRGRIRWTFRTGGEILAQPLVADDSVYVGSGDCKFYALTRDGKPRWTFDVGHPVYSSAVLADGKVIFAANNGHVYVLDPRTGARLWENSTPGYAIESRPFVAGSRIYYGSWDGHVYALNLSDGSVAWKTMGTGSAASVPGVMRYYSPADAGPVVVDGKVWVADRMYRLTVLDAETGRKLSEEKDIASVGLAEDGRSLYLRGTDGNLHKVGLDGSRLWSVPAQTGIIPSAPTEKDGIVYSASGTGRLLALDAKDGRKLWEYQVTPRLYVFSDPVPGDDGVYVTGMDGSVTALDISPRRE